MSTSIRTSSGRSFDFSRIRREDISVRDIARSLSRLHRFNGHTVVPYTVAEHSCRVSDRLPQPLKLAGLLHDAHEAYTGDMVSPWKNMVPGIREAEEAVQRSVLERFGIPFPLPREVHRVDRRMCATESRDLFAETADCATGSFPPYQDFRFTGAWGGSRSFNEFLSRCESLGVPC